MMPSHSSSISASNVCHCGRRFVRKEHLQRHKAIHEEPAFVCHICQKSFTRNDLLRRHVIRHEVVASPVSRRRQACDACRANKTRCDGGEGARCTLCAQRAFDCSYRGSRFVNRDDSLNILATEPPSENILGSPKQASTNWPSNPARPAGEIGDVVPAMKSLEGGGLSMGTAGASFVLKSIQDSADLFKKPLKPPPTDVKAWYTSCSAAYWQQVHGHWPVLHQPTFALESDPLAVTASMIIIGCWFNEPEDASDHIINAHNLLNDFFFKELSRLGAGLDEDGPWRFELYQAVILNIIFAFYSSNKQFIARAGLLLSILIATLRQIGMFSTESAEYQQRTYFPGTFLPYVLGNREKRARLVYSLIKIDAYFFIINGQYPRLQPEELDVGLLSTFAIWNAHPLDEFYKRLPQEPFSRAEKKLSQLAHGPDLLVTSELLIEDIQIGLCSMASALWRFILTHRSSEATGIGSKAQLAQQLENWGYQLERISNLCKSQEERRESAEFPLRAYFGQETEICPSVLTRVRWLLHETMMLQSLITSYLYADMHQLRIYVGKKTDTSTELPITNAIGKQDTNVLQWARSLDSRKAILMSLKVLEAQEKLSSQNDQNSKSIEPLVGTALSNSALVLWAWSAAMEGSCHCRKSSNGNMDDTDTVGNSDLSNNRPILTADLPLLCVCMAEVWIKRFSSICPN